MSSAIPKTVSLLLLIIIGYLFQRKMRSKEYLEGIKILILSLALPATIFIALLEIDFKSDLMVIPVLSLAFNLFMYGLMDKLPLQPVLKLPVNRYRTLIMLIPSLAPGLSCFPFIIEYSGHGPLAVAALADVGNKIFVLIISYTIAMKWFYEVNRDLSGNKKDKIKDLVYALINEPVNLVMVGALVMLSFGLDYTALPQSISLSIDRLSLMMTPMILLFIGLSIRLTWAQVKTIFSFLFFRSGIAFLISGAVLLFFPVKDLPTILLIVVFPQSACSFWPYAHMATVAKMENKLIGQRNKTFDLDFAMNILACSMPFSVVLIMTIYASGTFFSSTLTLFVCSLIFICLGIAVVVFSARWWPAIRPIKGEIAGPESGEKPASSHA